MILIFCAFGAEMNPLRVRMQAESKIKSDSVRGCYGRIGRCDVALVATGIGMRRARATAARALDLLHGIDLVLTTGVAGALRDDLEIGAVVLAERLMTRAAESFAPDETVEAPREWFIALGQKLENAGISYVHGPILTSQRAIATPADKRRAHAESGAIAVDMESAVIATEAVRRGLPFAYLRTIMDTAAQEVVGADLADETGRPRLLAAAKTLITNPRKIAGAVRLMRNLNVAADAMAAAVAAVARGLE